jgi:hypothetical protein
MNIQIANNLYEDGVLTHLFKAGLISAKIFTYREIYLWVHAQVQARGISINKAVLEAEVKFDKAERTIWRALNTFTEN